MGALLAVDVAAHAPIEVALSWHLQSNHYPAVPQSMIPVCIAAIDAINEDDSERSIELPECVQWRGEDFAPAWAIAEAHHLDPFLSDGEV